jgi:hypothetical protein
LTDGGADLGVFFFAGVGTPLAKVASRLALFWPAGDLELDLGVTAGVGRVDLRLGGIVEGEMERINADTCENLRSSEFSVTHLES